jgi:heme/copper-type cytochrome/quinol oxidase subunit 1
MSATPPTVAPARPELVTDTMPRRRPAWIETATSGDHKVVGLMFVATALSFLVLALTEFVLMRVQLIVPESTIIDPIIFDRLLSTYGATAAVFFGIPFGLGLFCYVVPLQIGARGLAFPRLASLAYWLYLFGGIALYASYLYNPPDAGVNPLPPLSDDVFSPFGGTDAWIIGVGLALLGFLLLAINLIVTVRNHRAPGMVWRRLPLFAWSAVVTSYVLVFTGAVMLAALAMLLIDRNYDGVFFDAGEGGSPILWQHLSWMFFNGAYVAMLLPAFGAISEIVAALSRKPQFAHRAVAGSFVAIGALGVLAWMQNMFTAPIPLGWSIVGMAMALALVVPFGLVFFNWIATLWGGALHLRAPLLFALGAISTIAIGLAGELAHSVIPVAWQTSATVATTMDTHYALIGGSVFGGFAALYYWYPKMTGRVMGEGMAKISFWLLLIGVHLTFLPMFFAALEGQVVDLSEYYQGLGLDGYNLVSTIGSFVLAAGIVMTLINAVYSVRHGIPAGHDPWGADTLEWFALSPPPPHNFDAIPDVRSTEPMRDIRDGVRRRTEGWRPPPPLERPVPAQAPASAEAPATAEASSSEESPSGGSGGSVA